MLTSGQLAECGQKADIIRPNAGSPQKKVEYIFVLSYNLKNETQLAKCTLVLVFCHICNSSRCINRINLYRKFINKSGQNLGYEIFEGRRRPGNFIEI